MTDLPPHRLGMVESRMMVLLALDKLGASTNLQLIAFFFETDLMNYFELQTALHDLKESGEVSAHALTADEMFTISPQGSQALAMFEGRIAPSLRTALVEAVPGFLSRARQQAELPTRIDRDSGQAYRVTLQVVEQGTPALQVQVNLPTHELAKRFADAWPKQAHAIYEHILHTLSQEEST